MVQRDPARRHADEMIDEASEASFPASDPPGFASLTGSGETGFEAPIAHDTSARRFEARYAEGTAFLRYELDPKGVMVILYTETPPPLRGKGIAGKIVERALEYARDRRLRVVPECGFVDWYIEQHPEWRSLLTTGD